MSADSVNNIAGTEALARWQAKADDWTAIADRINAAAGAAFKMAGAVKSWEWLLAEARWQRDFNAEWQSRNLQRVSAQTQTISDLTTALERIISSPDDPDDFNSACSYCGAYEIARAAIAKAENA